MGSPAHWREEGSLFKESPDRRTCQAPRRDGGPKMATGGVRVSRNRSADRMRPVRDWAIDGGRKSGAPLQKSRETVAAETAVWRMGIQKGMHPPRAEGKLEDTAKGQSMHDAPLRQNMGGWVLGRWVVSVGGRRRISPTPNLKGAELPDGPTWILTALRGASLAVAQRAPVSIGSARYSASRASRGHSVCPAPPDASQPARKTAPTSDTGGAAAALAIWATPPGRFAPPTIRHHPYY